MWEMLDSRAVGYREGASSRLPNQAASTSAVAASSSMGTAAAAAAAAHAATSQAPLRSTLRGNELREALSSSAART
eukprot:6197030-Pleurochrysis_carterae.AAC.1